MISGTFPHCSKKKNDRIHFATLFCPRRVVQFQVGQSHRNSFGRRKTVLIITETPAHVQIKRSRRFFFSLSLSLSLSLLVNSSVLFTTCPGTYALNQYSLVIRSSALSITERGPYRQCLFYFSSFSNAAID